MLTPEQHVRSMGDRIKYRRELKGLTQSALAKKIGVKRELVSQWETGEVREPAATRLILCARELGTTVEWLAFEDGPEERSALSASAPESRQAIKEEAPTYGRDTLPIEALTPGRQTLVLRIVDALFIEQSQRRTIPSRRLENHDWNWFNP